MIDLSGPGPATDEIPKPHSPTSVPANRGDNSKPVPFLFGGPLGAKTVVWSCARHKLASPLTSGI